MSVWKRIVLYLARKKARTILLFLYLFIMASFIMIIFPLKSSAEKEQERLGKTLGTGFVLKINTENGANIGTAEINGFTDSTYIGTKITDETIEKIMEIEGVADYTFPRKYIPVWTNLKLRPGGWADSEPWELLSAEALEVRKQVIYAFSCREGSLEKNFRTGALEISKGRNLKKNDQCKTIISENMAEKNGLSVGDVIAIEIKEGIYRPGNNPQKTWGNPIQLEIIGLFHMNFEQPYSEWTMESGYLENEIYIDLETYAQLDKIIDDNLGWEPVDIGYSEVIFFVEDSEKIDSILQEIRESEDINADSLLLYADQTAYESSAKPYRQICTLSGILFVIGISGMSVVLFLIMKLLIQGRRHEIGILCSIGIGKPEIALQMLMECMITAVAAVICSVLLSGVFLNVCSKAAGQLAAPDKREEAYRLTMRDGLYPEVEKIAAEEVVLITETDPRMVMRMIFFICGISGLCVIVSFVNASSLEPKISFRFHTHSSKAR